jgi:P-type conjugative transfer protein TrbJ
VSRKSRVPIVLTLLLAALLSTAAPAAANTVPVYDYVNWLLSYYQRYEQIANQARQITNQVRQIQQLAKSLESFADADWSHFDFHDLDALLGYGEHLGYLNQSVSALFDDTFPGYETPESWPEEFQTRVRRTRETLRLINRSLRTLSDADSQVDFLSVLQRRSQTADSPVEELETANMYANYSLVHFQRAIQANLLTANSIAVAQAEQLQMQASIEAARNGWIERDPFPEGYDEGPGHTGVPAGWAYSIF